MAPPNHNPQGILSKIRDIVDTTVVATGTGSIAPAMAALAVPATAVIAKMKVLACLGESFWF